MSLSRTRCEIVNSTAAELPPTAAAMERACASIPEEGSSGSPLLSDGSGTIINGCSWRLDGRSGS